MVTCWESRSFLIWCALLANIVKTEEVFNTTPSPVKSNFSCLNRLMGFYADIEANCRVYHTCDDHGNKFTYRCPEETAFRQDALICDHAHLVDCQATIYPSTQSTNENIDRDNATPPNKSPIVTIGAIDDDRLSFSRSFRVIQRPNEAKPDKNQPGFVFSASVFLRDHDQTRSQVLGPIMSTCRTCRQNANTKNRVIDSTVRTFPATLNSWDSRSDKMNTPRLQLQTSSSSRTSDFARDKNIVDFRRSFAPISNPSPSRTIALDVTQRPPFKDSSSSIHNSNYHPYSETLRSIQVNAIHASSTKHTTELPVHALTLSLKPLVPNELEYDPYYPREPTSTEAYYTPSDRGRINANTRLSTSSQIPQAFAHSGLTFKIPSTLPDLNTLEDLVDRRKFFYIPRANIKSI